MQTTHMACDGFWFSLLRSLYLITFVYINFVFSMNQFRVVHFVGIHGFTKSYHLPAVVPTARRQGAAVRSRSAGSRSRSVAVATERT